MGGVCTLAVVVLRNLIIQTTFHEIAANIGLNFDQIPHMPAWLRDAGFEYVDSVEKIVPIGPWPREKKLKEIGRYYQVHLLEGGKNSATTLSPSTRLATFGVWDLIHCNLPTSLSALFSEYESAFICVKGGVRMEMLTLKTNGKLHHGSVHT